MIFMKTVASGLTCAIICLSGECTQQLGGQHMHELFNFRVNKRLLSELIASQSIKSLYRDAIRFTDQHVWTSF